MGLERNDSSKDGARCHAASIGAARQCHSGRQPSLGLGAAVGRCLESYVSTQRRRLGQGGSRRARPSGKGDEQVTGSGVVSQIERNTQYRRTGSRPIALTDEREVQRDAGRTRRGGVPLTVKGQIELHGSGARGCAITLTS